MIGPHPENALFALLLPGMVFCILMFMDRKKHVPKVVVFGYQLPIWLVYVVVFFTAPLMLVLALVQSLKRS